MTHEDLRQFSKREMVRQVVRDNPGLFQESNKEISRAIAERFGTNVDEGSIVSAIGGQKTRMKVNRDAAYKTLRDFATLCNQSEGQMRYVFREFLQAWLKAKANPVVTP